MPRRSANRPRTVSLPIGLTTPLQHMLSVINDPEAPAARRDKMAIAAAPYCHPRVADKGKQASGSEDEEGAEEQDDEVEEEIALPGDEVDDSQLKQEVDQKALSGQEALLDGAIVRVVLDNLLKGKFSRL